jgi:hypothetical protein
MKALNFHVRHEVNPEGVWGVLDALASENEIIHITQYDRQLSRLRHLGLITNQGNLTLTESGMEMHRIGLVRVDTMWDLMHFMHYTHWRSSEPTENTMFFTFREYCNLLYSKRVTSITQLRKSFAVEVAGIITSSPYFSSEIPELAKGAVSLSTNSLVGVEHWLSKLSPRVITENGQFELRHYCSPELLLLALGYMSEVTEAQLGVDQLLTQEKRELLCRICLIEEECLDQLLDWLYPEYPMFVESGTRTGSYGRFVRVLHLPQLKDLLQ